MRVTDDLPQLRFLLWSRASTEISEAEAFELYEVNRQWVEVSTMTPFERAFFDRLVREIGRGVFLG
ncbi:MAG: hypothetical protein ACHREM_32590 [Polyangiales bacterium]